MIKTRYRTLLPVIMLAMLVLSACSIIPLRGDFITVRGSGGVVEETREVSGVTGVELATLGNLTIEVGDKEAFRIEAQENLMEYIETEVLSGKLIIRTQDNVRLVTTRSVNYYLTVTGLDRIEISSSGNIEVPDLESERFSITISSSGNLDMGDLEADSLTVRISSSGNVDMGELNADTIEVDISSSGNLDIAGGEVITQDITINSSGNYRAQDLASDEVDARLNSSGSTTIWVNDHLRAILKSSGDVRYRGNPTLDVSTSSSGKVRPIGD